MHTNKSFNKFYMSENGMRPSPAEMGINPLEQLGLTEAELKFCSPVSNGESYRVHDMITLFPELDTFISSIQDPELRANIEKHIQYYRDNKGGSGDILTSLHTLIETHTKGHFFNFPAKVQQSAEFQALVSKYKRLNEAHKVGMAALTAAALQASYDASAREGIARRKREGEEGILPKLGVPGTFQTPDGAIRGTVLPGAPVGGPYIIKTPQGNIRVSKITGAGY